MPYSPPIGYGGFGSTSGASGGGTALIPKYGPNGLIVGYVGAGGNTPGYQSPIIGSSGLITGYSGGNPNYQTGLTTGTSGDPNHTFNPITGLNAQGLTPGQQAAKDYQTDTSLTSTTKSQPVAGATSDLLGKESQLANTTLGTFNDYLNEAKQLQQQGGAAIQRDTNTFNNLPGQLSSTLSDIVRQYANQTNNLIGRVSDINAQNKATVGQNIDTANTLNTEQQKVYDQDIASLADLNAEYERAARAVGAQAVSAAQAKANAAQSATGTPATNSGYWNREAANIYSGVMLPVEQQIAQNRLSELTNYITPLQTQGYNQRMNTLTNYVSPQQQNLYANDIAQVTGLELPVAQSLVQYGITNANQVAQLQASLAGRSLSEQIQFLSSMGMPIQMAQSLAASLPSGLGQLANIDQSNTYYGLAQNYQNPLGGASLPTYNLPLPGGNSGGYGGGYSGGYNYQPPAGFNYGNFNMGNPVSVGRTPIGGTVNPNSPTMGQTMPVTPATSYPGYYFGNQNSPGYDLSQEEANYYQNLYPWG